jgi:uncharacterized protein YjgD (DUF1641 family)
MGLFDDDEFSGGGLGLAPRNNTPVAHNIDSPLFKIGAILQGVSSGMRGQPNPAMLQMRDEMALRQRRDAMVGQAEKAKLAEEKEDFDQVSKILDILTKSGAPPEHTTKVLRQAVKSMPRLSARFGSVIDDVELNGKPEEFVWKGHKADKPLTDGTGKVWPAGKTYNVTGSTSGGKLSIKSVEDIEAVQEPLVARQERQIAAVDARATEREVNTDRRHDERLAQQSAQYQQTFQRLAANHAETMKEMRGRYGRLSDTAITKLTDLKEGEAVLTQLRTARAKAFSSGQPISEAMKGAILASSNAATIKEAFINEGAATTDADRAYIGAHNAVIGSLYKLTSERQMSQPDAERNLRSLNPAVSQKQFEANINPRIESLRRQSQILTDAYSENRNVPDALRPGATQGGAAAPAQQRRRAVNPKTGEAVEWDGKAWVKVP